MHFGEYELSPSLIGLSPLPTGHPKTFQRQPVRSSTLCYQSFNLPMGRSQGFASNPTNYAPLFRLAFASAPLFQNLTLQHKITRWLIIQKVRGCAYVYRATTDCRQLVSDSISLPSRGSFRLSLTVLVHYRSMMSI